jgi:alkylation response protein AidB-like acyl-CoA dehydrogenase
LRACGLDAVLTEIAGGVVATLAVHAKGSRLGGAPMTLRHGRVRGRAVAVPNVSRAELIVTLAKSLDGYVAVAVRGGDGVTILAGESTDPAQPVADVEIDTEPLASAPVDLESALTAPLVAAAADLVGVASAALHRSVEHAKSRRQFGAPIGAFQGIKHALADNYVGVERARSLTYAAAARLADPNTAPADAWTAAALAKAAAGDAAASCARTAVQVHGALAQTWEHDMHLYVRHAWQGAALLGDSRALYHEVGCRFVGGAA